MRVNTLSQYSGAINCQTMCNNFTNKLDNAYPRCRLRSACGLLLYMTTVLCETAEYCVKPNDTVNIVQNDNPCHTIDHYISNKRKYFERDNIIITFLPGQHVSMQPLVIKNVENITIQVASDEKVYLQLVPTFSCQCVQTSSVYKFCCSVFLFYK